MSVLKTGREHIEAEIKQAANASKGSFQRPNIIFPGKLIKEFSPEDKLKVFAVAFAYSQQDEANYQFAQIAGEHIAKNPYGFTDAFQFDLERHDTRLLERYVRQALETVRTVFALVTSDNLIPYTYADFLHSTQGLVQKHASNLGILNEIIRSHDDAMHLTTSGKDLVAKLREPHPSGKTLHERMVDFLPVVDGGEEMSIAQYRIIERLFDENINAVKHLPGGKEQKLLGMSLFIGTHLVGNINHGWTRRMLGITKQSIEYRLGEACGLVDNMAVTPKGFGVACAYET
ncbi:hypothetical protein ACFL2V_16335 [Pseudomonadota bacterium]